MEKIFSDGEYGIWMSDLPKIPQWGSRARTPIPLLGVSASPSKGEGFLQIQSKQGQRT